jgi:hypothetical protein
VSALARPDPAACIHHGLAVDAAALDASGVIVATADGSRPPLEAIATALRFPAYFGGNLDALDECLRDLARWWPAVRGWVLCVPDADRERWQTIEPSWRDAAAAHAAEGRSLHLVYGAPTSACRKSPARRR